MKHNKEVRNVTHERPLLAGHNVNVQHVVRHQPLIRFVDGLHGAIFELHQQEIVEHALIISVSCRISNEHTRKLAKSKCDARFVLS